MMALPVAALVLLAGGAILENWDEYATGRRTARNIGHHGRLAGLVHELQLERGLSAGFAGSGGRLFGDALRKQRLATDRVKADVTAHLRDDREALAPLARRKLRTLSQTLDLSKLRAKVDAASPTETALRGYSERTAAALHLMSVLHMSAADAPLVGLCRSHLAVRWLIERAGQERAALNHVFASAQDERLALGEALGYLALQETLLAEFESIATDPHRALLVATYEDPAVVEVEGWRQRASERDGQIGSSEAEIWFAASTRRIKLLEGVAEQVLEDLLARSEVLPRRAVVAEFGYAGLIFGVLLASLFLVRWYEVLEIASRARVVAAAEELETRVAERTADLSDANERLKAQHAQLLQAEKLSSIGLLASGVAHEVNNPLLGIKSCLDSLRRGTLPEARRATYWESVEAALARIEEIVRGLTDYARERPHQRVVVSLADTVEGCLRLAAPAAVKGHVECRQALPEAPLHVLVDPNQLDQALLNIVLNAIQASPPGGEVVVSAETRDGRHGISVRDHGPGIPAEIRDRIFDPFFSTKPEGEGTGLGLAVTLGLAQSNDGAVEVESVDGEGSRFTIWFPAAPSSEPLAREVAGDA